MLTSRSLTSLLEIVLEAAGHRLQIAHTTRSLTTTTRTLQSPVVYEHHFHTITIYNVSSSHRGIRKNHNGSSGCGKHDDRIFCKSCGSCHVSYQMKKYLSSIIIVSTTMHKHTPFSSSFLLFHSSFASLYQSFTYHSLLGNTAILYQHQKEKRSVVILHQASNHHCTNPFSSITLPSTSLHIYDTMDHSQSQSYTIRSIHSIPLFIISTIISHLLIPHSTLHSLYSINAFHWRTNSIAVLYRELP